MTEDTRPSDAQIAPTVARPHPQAAPFTQKSPVFAAKTTHNTLIINGLKLKRLKTDKVPKFAHLCKNECV